MHAGFNARCKNSICRGKKMKRAVITGLGIVSSIGTGCEEVEQSLRAGRSGITYSEEFKNAGLRSHVWGPVKKQSGVPIERKLVRFMSEASIHAFRAMQQAIDDARLPAHIVSNERTGVIVGSGAGSPHSQVASADAMRATGLRGVGPFVIVRGMPSTHAANLTTAFKIRGVSYSICSACAASAHCIGNAVELIQLGKQDIVFAGGAEELCWEVACQFDAMGALSTRYNDDPPRASRTYDATRDGFVLAGGAGIVVVEELEHAVSRGAHVYAEVIGYGASTDGVDMVAPSGEGATRSMRMALRTTETPIDYLNPHGTSTPIGDVVELEAIRQVFGNTIPPLSSTKSITGHSLGAAGVHEFIYTLLMLEHSFIAPSININVLDEQARAANIVTQMTPRELTTVMTNSFGFGGVNATLVMRKL